jgi:hypothetical protein
MAYQVGDADGSTLVLDPPVVDAGLAAPQTS